MKNIHILVTRQKENPILSWFTWGRYTWVDHSTFELEDT